MPEPEEKLSVQIDGACIARMLDQYSKVKDGELHLWKHLAIALEGRLAQALERESRLQFALVEAGLDIGEPWEKEAEEVEFPEVDMGRNLAAKMGGQR
jgi:hypothetical protein